jgi:hypothetical protein
METNNIQGLNIQLLQLTYNKVAFNNINNTCKRWFNSRKYVNFDINSSNQNCKFNNLSDFIDNIIKSDRKLY